MKNPLYDKDALQKGVLKAYENIKTFQTAIDDERKTIDTYTTIIKEHEKYEQYIERQTTERNKT